MGTNRETDLTLPMGEQPLVEGVSAGPITADTFAGRIHVEWDNSATVTPLGQLPFFIEYLKQGGLFDGWVADCPLHYTSPNAPNKRDVLGTVMLSVPAGHWRYAHMTALRCDPVNPPLLGMAEVVSEDAGVGASNPSLPKRNRSLVTPPVKFQILKIHAAETRPGKRPPRWEAPDFPRQRPAHCPLTLGNVGGSPTPGNHTAETALAGWGARIRTWEWRNQNPQKAFDMQRLSGLMLHLCRIRQ